MPVELLTTTKHNRVDNNCLYPTMGKLSELVIRVVNPSELAQWYKDVMGMDVREDLVKNTWSAFYPGPGVTLDTRREQAGGRRKSRRWRR